MLSLVWCMLSILIRISANGNKDNPSIQQDLCPAQCICYRRNVNCAQMDMIILPQDVPLSTLILNLGLNRISRIPSGYFQYFNVIETLNLTKNLIENLHNATFKGLNALEDLDLSRNRIKSLENGIFRTLPNLRHLYLQHNHLEVLLDGTFMNLMHLKRLFLYDNQIKYVPETAFGIIENQLELQIDQNPLYCDCEIIWILDSVLSYVTGLCRFPKGLDGVPLGHLKRDQFKCRTVRTVPFGEKPYFIRTPDTIQTTDTVPEIVLPCEANGTAPITVKWSHNGIEIDPITVRHTITDTGSLIIRPVKNVDHGTYRCTAQNPYGRISTEITLIINVAPVFTVHPESGTVDIGGTIELECVAVASPPPEIVWFRDDVEITNVPERVHLSPDGTFLRIRNASITDTGLYICEARNRLGFREVSAEITVTEIERTPPKFLFQPYNIEALIGSTIELPCRAIGGGAAAPGIQWQKDGATLQRTGRTKVSLSGNLYIYQLTFEDQGRYECTAINPYGRITAAAYVTVKSPENVLDDDKLIKIAFSEASHEVDSAINKTLEQLFGAKGHVHSSVEIFRVIRFPDAPARELARAAEVYERTLTNIRKYIAQGMRTNQNTTENKEFAYKDLLSEDHLTLIARLSGCMTHRPQNNCTNWCFHRKYRTIDGTCNNLQHPMWGASLTGFRRVLPAQYENGFSTPIGWDKSRTYFGHTKPASRLVSARLIRTEHVTPDREITHMVMQWGQFLDHDLDHAIPSVSSESWDGIDCKKSCNFAPPCYPMEVPRDDSRVTNRRCIDFVRSSAICGSGMTSVFFETFQNREQINQLTSFIDASQVYGYSDELARNLRDSNGRLREGVTYADRKPLLPYAQAQNGVDCRRNLSESTINCFVAGDIRVNEQIGLIAIHTLWMREHNRLARELRALNLHWDDDIVYEEARKIVGGAMQHITYNHWLPLIVGPLDHAPPQYDPNVDMRISNVFATAALRFGHTLINPILHRFKADYRTPIREGHLPLKKAFFAPWRIVEEGGIDPVVRGLIAAPAKLKRSRENLNDHLTEHLFESGHAVALDLAAMNIHRGRDHALPGYLEFRAFCNLSGLNDTFAHLAKDIQDPTVLNDLRELYGHPGNIDVFVGGILEDPVPEGRVGPLFRCLLLEQFQRLKIGDRFYYENPNVFRPDQLMQIKQYSLSRLICDNSDNIHRVPVDAFRLPDLQTPPYQDCDKLRKIDLKPWIECCDRTTSSCNLNNRQRRSTRPITNENQVLREKIAMLERKYTQLEDEFKKKFPHF